MINENEKDDNLGTFSWQIVIYKTHTCLQKKGNKSKDRSNVFS